MTFDDTARPAAPEHSTAGERPHDLKAQPGCRCHSCGDHYRVDINVPDEVWRQVGMPSSSGLLCGKCIANRLEDLGEFNAFALVPVSDDHDTVTRVARALAAHDGYDWPVDDSATQTYAGYDLDRAVARPGYYLDRARTAVQTLRDAPQ